MSVPEFNPTTVFLLIVAWTTVAILFGLLIGKCIDEADAAEAEDDSTWLDDAPTDVLSTAEVNRRIERIEAEMRHPSGRIDRRLCRCGHVAESHRHYRQGSDCGSCSCTAFRHGAVSA